MGVQDRISSAAFDKDDNTGDLNYEKDEKMI
jgi:hypothetical protein